MSAGSIWGSAAVVDVDDEVVAGVLDGGDDSVSATVVAVVVVATVVLLVGAAAVVVGSAAFSPGSATGGVDDRVAPIVEHRRVGSVGLRRGRARHGR